MVNLDEGKQGSSVTVLVDLADDSKIELDKALSTFYRSVDDERSN